MAFSREIIKKVLQYVRFRVPQTEEKNSYYTEIGNTLVRVSNHCTWLYRWDEILEKNPKWKGKPIVSIVFEDSGNTFSNKCLVLRRFRMKPIKVMEYVYPLQGNPQFITPQDERLIINGIKQIQGGKYTDLTNKCSEPILRISQNPPDVPPTKTMNNNENKQYNNMNKKLIRLTESDLHRIVKESVNRILKEDDSNAPTAKDRGFEEFLRNKQNGESSSASVDRAYEYMCGHAEEMQQKIDDIIEFIQQDLIGLYGSSRNKRIENYMFKKLDFLSSLRKDFQTDSPIMQSYLNHMINPIR